VVVLPLVPVMPPASVPGWDGGRTRRSGGPEPGGRQAPAPPSPPGRSQLLFADDHPGAPVQGRGQEAVAVGALAFQSDKNAPRRDFLGMIGHGGDGETVVTRQVTAFQAGQEFS